MTMTTTFPGFTADFAVRTRSESYRTRALARAFGEVSAANDPHGIECHTGHCGCYLDDWFGASCLCCEYW